MIDIKIVKGRFVTCWPMPQTTEDEKRALGWRQFLSRRRYSQTIINRSAGLDGPSGIYDQVATKQDHQ